MKLNRRESRLAILTLIAVLGALTYGVGEPRYQEWQESQQEKALLMRRQEAAKRLLNQSGELDARLNQLREALPRYAMGVDVTSQLLRNLQQIADRHRLTLLRREPEAEREIGDLYEMAITCTWEGELEALIHFLYALQAQGAIVDIRQLTVAPVQGAPQRLRGTLTVDYAYGRTAADARLNKESVLARGTERNNIVQSL